MKLAIIDATLHDKNSRQYITELTKRKVGVYVAKNHSQFVNNYGSLKKYRGLLLNTNSAIEAAEIIKTYPKLHVAFITDDITHNKTHTFPIFNRKSVDEIVKYFSLKNHLVRKVKHKTKQIKHKVSKLKNQK